MAGECLSVVWGRALGAAFHVPGGGCPPARSGQGHFRPSGLHDRGGIL